MLVTHIKANINCESDPESSPKKYTVADACKIQISSKKCDLSFELLTCPQGNFKMKHVNKALKMRFEKDLNYYKTIDIKTDRKNYNFEIERDDLLKIREYTTIQLNNIAEVKINGVLVESKSSQY